MAQVGDPADLVAGTDLRDVADLDLLKESADRASGDLSLSVGVLNGNAAFDAEDLADMGSLPHQFVLTG